MGDQRGAAFSAGALQVLRARSRLRCSALQNCLAAMDCIRNWDFFLEQMPHLSVPRFSRAVYKKGGKSLFRQRSTIEDIPLRQHPFLVGNYKMRYIHTHTHVRFFGICNQNVHKEGFGLTRLAMVGLFLMFLSSAAPRVTNKLLSLKTVANGWKTRGIVCRWAGGSFAGAQRSGASIFRLMQRPEYFPM